MNLAEHTTDHKSLFEPLGFEYHEEPTTDSVRTVCWLHRLPAFELPDSNNLDEPAAPFFLVLSVNYELVIDDVPDVPSSANFNYYFEGVRLELRDARTNEPLGTLHLKITTTSQLKALLSTFPSQKRGEIL
ncbi:MAG: hypothetical protein WAO02_15585 [Verrucomicrobiia bacterium]